MLGLRVGPGADILRKPWGLQVECLLESNQALLQVVVVEARPPLVTCRATMHILAHD